MLPRLIHFDHQRKLICSIMAVFVFGLISCNRSVKVRVLDQVVDKEALSLQIPVLVQTFLKKPFPLKVGSQTISATYENIGFWVDESLIQKQSDALAHQGGLKDQILQKMKGKSAEVLFTLPLKIDVEKATDFLLKIKSQVDAAPIDDRLDSVNNTLVPGSPGILLQVFDSIVLLKYEARRISGGGKEGSLNLAWVEIPAQRSGPAPQKDDFRVLLGSFETKYPYGPSDSNRTGNLKLGGERMDGQVIQPGAVLSYNETVGERTERAGFRVAPEIGGAELVDGVGGGQCQLSSTLHAAAFFGGLEILETKPHSRPSSYIPPGLDSTVVYPTAGNPKGIDLKIRNPYDFPVMIRYSVGEGFVRVKIFGRARLYDRVEFHREVLSVIAYSATPIKRLDPNMPLGQVVLDQAGHVGYKIRRTRCFVRKGQTELICPDKNDTQNTWVVVYSEVPKIVREGTGPSTLKPIRTPSPHYVKGIKDPKVPFVLSQ